MSVLPGWSHPDGQNADDGLGVDLSALKKVRPPELAVRFIFGAAVSAVAGIVGIVWGPHVGGLLLAFPAILPAAMTLIQKRDGREKADQEAFGAVAGGLGLVAFALAMTFLVTRIAGEGALAVALWAWIIVAVVTWAPLHRLLCRRLGN